MEVRTVNNFPVIKADGEVDHWRSPELEQKINELIGQGINDVILDFTELTYLDSGGVSVLFLELQKLQPKNGKLIIVTDNPDIIKILSLVKITKQKRFLLFAELEEALVSITQ